MENAISENSMDKFNRRLYIATECVAQKTDQRKSSKISTEKEKDGKQQQFRRQRRYKEKD